MSVPLVYRDMPAAAGVERLPVPVAVAFPQPQASLLSHQFQFAWPGVPERPGPQVCALPVDGDDLGGDPLPRRVVAGQFDNHGIFGHRSRLDALAPVEPGQVGDEAFDDEHPTRVQHARHVAQALSLPGLAKQAWRVKNEAPYVELRVVDAVRVGRVATARTLVKNCRR